MSSFDLLSTKLYFPPERINLVPRPRLVERLKFGLRGSLTLVSAPVGYGKTTLISEWYAAAGKDFAAAWLSLDSSDNDLERFLTYLTAALETIKTGLVKNTIALLNAAQLPPLEAILTVLINDLGDFNRDIILVLDDYQVIKDSAIHEGLVFLLDHCPPCLHMVLLTRVDPPFPFGRLRVRNQLVEIRAADLRFTAGEIEAFLTGVMDIRLSTTDVEALAARTEGWIAGLQLAALSFQGQEDLSGVVAKFTGSHHYVVDYLIEEVLNRQPEAVRHFLLHTAILERMNSALCNALTLGSEGQALLEKLERSNLFIIPLDSERQWYRYHHFFVDLLRSRLDHTQPEMVGELHHRASIWYQAHGLIPEAFQHALAGRHFEAAAQIVESAGNDLLATGAWGQLLRWLQTLPEEIIQARPALGIFYAWSLVLTGQLEDIDQRLSEIEVTVLAGKSTLQKTDQNFHWQTQAIRSRAAYLRGDFQQAIECSEAALIALEQQDLITRGILGITLGSSYLLAGELTKASQILEHTQKINQQAGNLLFAIDAAGSLAQIQEAQGYLRQAAETYRGIVRLSEASINPNVMAACLNLGNVQYEWNDLDEAEQNFQTCLEIARKIHALDGDLYALLGLAKVKLARRDHQACTALTQQARTVQQNFAQSILGQHAAAVLAQISLMEGDWQAVESWAAEHSLPQDDISPINLFLRKIEYLTLAHLLIQQGQPADAEHFLEKMYLVAETTGLTGCQVEILALIALARKDQGKDPGAMQALTEALKRAEPERRLRSFIDLGEPLRPLLQKVANQSASRTAAHSILAAMSEAERGIPFGRQELIEQISDRELDVLRLLVQGKSNKEIAQELYLATGTVKKHLNNIYGKLEVNNRTQCVRRAQELNLI